MKSLLRKEIDGLLARLPQPAHAPLPPDAAEAALDWGVAVCYRTGARERSSGSAWVPANLVAKAMEYAIEDRQAALERGDTTPWVRLLAYDDMHIDSLSIEPAAVAKLNEILLAIGFDPETPEPPTCRWWKPPVDMRGMCPSTLSIGR